MKNKMLASFAILMVALAGVGYAFGHWFEILNVTGTVNTGNVNVWWSAATSNDPVGPTLDPGLAPATFSGTTPPYYVATGAWTTYSKNVASTTVTTTDTDGDTNAESGLATIAFTNVYPSYAPMITLTITSTGTIPVHLDGLQYAFSEIDPIDPASGPWTDGGYTELQGAGVYLVGWDVRVTHISPPSTTEEAKIKGTYTGTYTDFAGVTPVVSASLETDLYGYLSNPANVQLHQGDSITIRLIYHFEQYMQETDDMYFGIRTRWTQWNLAGDTLTPWTPRAYS